MLYIYIFFLKKERLKMFKMRKKRGSKKKKKRNIKRCGRMMRFQVECCAPEPRLVLKYPHPWTSPSGMRSVAHCMLHVWVATPLCASIPACSQESRARWEGSVWVRMQMVRPQLFSRLETRSSRRRSRSMFHPERHQWPTAGDLIHKSWEILWYPWDNSHPPQFFIYFF